MAFSPDGKRLASSSSGMNSVVKVWDVASGKETLTLGQSLEAYSVAFSPDGNRLASGSWKTVNIWDAAAWPESKARRESGRASLI